MGSLIPLLVSVPYLLLFLFSAFSSNHLQGFSVTTCASGFRGGCCFGERSLESLAGCLSPLVLIHIHPDGVKRAGEAGQLLHRKKKSLRWTKCRRRWCIKHEMVGEEGSCTMELGSLRTEMWG